MANFFDQFDTVQAPAAAPSSAQPQGAAPANFFDQFDVPASSAASSDQPASPTVTGSPQSAGDALDMVEGTGTAAYNDGSGKRDRTVGDAMNRLGDMTVAAADGFSNAIPFTDRMTAGLSAVTGLGGHFGDYSGALASLHADEGAAMAKEPVAATAGGLAGGATLPMPAMGWMGRGAAATAEAAALAKAAATGTEVAKDTTPFMVKAARGVAAGSLIGGLQGASASSDLTDIGQTARDAGTGAGVGAGFGALVPAVGAVGGAVARKVMGDTVAAVPGVNTAARDVVLGAIAKDGPEAVQQRAAAYGDPAMLFDYGTGLKGVAQGLAAKDGAAAAPIVDALGNREAATNDRVRTGLMQNFGPAQDPTAVTNTITDAGQAATQPLFARAAAAGVPWSDETESLLQRPAVASAMQDAAKSAANSGTPLPSITLDAAGQPVASDAAMQAYEAGTRPAVTSALADFLGADPARGPLSLEDALMAQRKAASDPAYAAYRSMSVPMTPDLAEVLNRPSVAAAIPAAERKAADQGRSIYVPGPAPETGAASAARDIPDPTEGLGTPYTVPPTQGMPGAQFTAPPRPSGPAPTSLVSFLQRGGGIQPNGGDLKSMGLDRFPGLVREGGMTLDRAREAATEAGYLGGDTAHAMANTTPNDLMDALGNHPTYSVHDGDAVAARQAYADHQASRGAPTSHDLATETVRQHLLDGGLTARDIDPATLDTAASLVDRHGMHPGDAYEAAVLSPPFPGDTPMPARAGASTSAPQRQLTPEGIDYLKRTLDDKASTARQGGNRDDAAIFTGLKAQLLGAIERHPDPSIAEAYTAARQAYAGPSREIDALNAGRAAFGDNVTAEQVQREMGALGTDGERQQYRNGLFAAGREKLNKAGDTKAFVDMVSGNQAIRDKFAAVAPHPEALATFNRVMDRARQTFTEAQRPTPEAWHGALNTLDAKAAKGEPGMVAARDALAAHLGQNPDFARARGIKSDYAGLRDAIDYGRGSLAGGSDPVWPSAYADRLAAMTPAERAANQVGQRSLMEEAVGTKPNDQLAIKQLFQTGNTPGYTAPGVTPGNPDLSGWNAQKLAESFGHAPVARMQELLNANDAMHDTFGKVVEGSKTARTRAMVESLSDQEWKPTDLMKEGHGDDTTLGLIRSLMAKGVNTVGHAFQNAPSNVARDLDIARIGTLTGPERDAMMAQLFDRLPAYQAREGVANGVQSHSMALAAALAGGVGADMADPLRNMDPATRQRLLAEALAARSTARRQ